VTVQVSHEPAASRFEAVVEGRLRRADGRRADPRSAAPAEVQP
jgi:hypothetical protein